MEARPPYPGSMDLRRAVVVDHWALVRVGIGTILRHMSIRVVNESAQAADGLRQAKVQQADLVVLGTFLDLEAAEAVSLARTLDPPAKVVFLLAQPDAASLAGVLSAGADAVLTRGGEDGELEQAIRRVVSGERWVTPTLSLLLAGAVTGQAEPPEESLLTAKEHRVLVGLAGGRSNKELADDLIMSGSTVKTHLSHIYAKLGVKSRKEAIARAVELGLLT